MTHARGIREICILCFALGVGGLLLVTGCAEPEPIRIAFTGALSGKNSEVPISVRNAVLMKVDEVNAAGGIKGRPVEVSFFDNQGEPLKCAGQFDAILNGGFRFVMGPVFSQMAESTLAAIQGKDVLVLSATMSTDYLSGRDDNFIRTVWSTSDQARRLARYAAEKEYKTVAVVYDLSNRKYAENVYKLFRKLSEKQGMTFPLVVPLDVKKEIRIASVAEDIVKVRPDAVLMCLSAIDAANLAQQLKKNGSGSSFMGSSWTQTNDLIEHGGRAVEGMVLIAVSQTDGKSPEQTAFESAYRDRYDSDPSFPALLGYDAASVLMQGFRRAGALTPTAVKKAILDQGRFEGITYPVLMDKYGDTHGEFKLVIVKDNQYHPLD